MIALSRSTDRGATWSRPRNISGDTRGSDAVMPAIAVDNATGYVVAAWIDRRDDPSNRMARVYATKSSDGGVTWNEPQPFSSPFSLDAPFIGDYNATAALAGHWLTAFSDAGGYMAVARIDLGQPVVLTPPPPRRRAVHP